MTIPRNLSALAPNVSTSGVNAVSGGGTGLSTLTGANNALYSTSSSAMTAGTLPVAAGGTGATSLTANNVLLGNGTSAVQVVAPGTNGNVLTSNGTTWVSQASSSAGGGGTTATGNVTLTSSSSGAQSITTTAYGQWVKLPDATTMTKAAINFNIRNAGNYPLKILDNASNVLGFIAPKLSATVGCADSSTAAGVWVIEGTTPLAVTTNYLNNTINYSNRGFCTALDDSRTFISFIDTTANLYGVVYDAATGTFGSATLISASLAGTSSTGIKLSSNSVLIAYSRTSLMCGRVLSISGTTITVNAEATAAASLAGNNPSFTQVGSAYVIDRAPGASGYLQVFTVSGTTVSIGTEVAADGIIARQDNAPGYPTVFSVTSSVFVRFSYTASTAVYARAYSISGTTITAGTLLTLSTTSSYLTSLRSFVCGSQWALVYPNSSNQSVCSIISISGTTCSASTVTAISQNMANNNNLDALVSGNKVIVCALTSSAPASVYFNVITNSSGTASAGTQVSQASAGSVGFQYMMALTASNNLATFGMNAADMGTTTFAMFVIDYSGSSPVIVDIPRAKNNQPYASNSYDQNILPLPRNQFGRSTYVVGSTTGTLYSFAGPTQGGTGFATFITNGATFSLEYLSFRAFVTTWETSASSNEAWSSTKANPNASSPGTYISRMECAST